MDNKLNDVLCDTLTCLQDSFMMFFLLLESWRAEEERSSWPTGSRDMKPWFGNILMFFLSSSPSFFCHFLLPPVLSSFIYYHLIPIMFFHPYAKLDKFPCSKAQIRCQSVWRRKRWSPLMDSR